MTPAEKKKLDEYIDKLFQNFRSLSLKERIRVFELWEEAIKMGLYDGLDPKPVLNWVAKQKMWLQIREEYQEMKGNPETITILAKKYGNTPGAIERIIHDSE